jgi:hypothetical protein
MAKTSMYSGGRCIRNVVIRVIHLYRQGNWQAWHYACNVTLPKLSASCFLLPNHKYSEVICCQSNHKYSVLITSVWL